MIMKKLLVTIMMLLPMMAYAYDFEKDGIYYNITSLQDLTVDVTSGDNSYSGNITIPESVIYADKVFKVTGIAERGFANSGITGINLPNTITDLKIEAFAGCYNLESLSIPGSVTSFQRGVLLGCYNLSNVRIEDSDNSLFMSMVTIYSNGYSSFRDCNLKSVYIGRSLISNHSGDQGIFSNHKKLTKVEFGEKIEEIAGGMFYSCTGLEKIVFSKNIKRIGWSALYDVYLNEGLENIEGEVFRGCKQLKSIVLPSTLNRIETNVFYDATSINSIVCKATIPPTIYESTFAGITYLNAILHVPTSTESLYREAIGWKDFVNITESGLYKLTYLIDNEFYKSYELEFDAIIIPEAEPTKETYKFSGWSEIPETMPAHDVVVTGTFERYFDVGNLTKAVDFVMNNSASAEDVALYDLNNNKKLDIGDVILIVKFILNNNSNNAPNYIGRRAGEIADLAQYTAAQFEVKTTGDVDIRLVKSMEQTHQMMYQQKDANTYAVVVYSLTNQLMQPENGKIIETDNISDILSIENVTVATPTGETAYYQTLSATTGIEQIGDENGTVVVYDLKGNRLNSGKALNKGIYIVNGKKAVVR